MSRSERRPSRAAMACASSSRSATPWASRITSSARIPTSPRSSPRSRKPMRIRFPSRCSSAGGPWFRRADEILRDSRTFGRGTPAMMKREDCFKVLARHVTNDDVVVATYSSAVEWNDLGPRVLNYFSMGAMGLASSHALGLALASPNRRIIVLDGDGSLLMNLGSLVTVGAAAPKNLVHFVSRNGTYEANGGHPIPHPKVDFSGIARSARYALTCDFSQLASFQQPIVHVLSQPGPVFATLHVERSRPLTYDYRALYDAGKRKAIVETLAKSAN